MGTPVTGRKVTKGSYFKGELKFFCILFFQEKYERIIPPPD